MLGTGFSGGRNSEHIRGKNFLPFQNLERVGYLWNSRSQEVPAWAYYFLFLLKN